MNKLGRKLYATEETLEVATSTPPPPARIETADSKDAVTDPLSDPGAAWRPVSMDATDSNWEQEKSRLRIDLEQARHEAQATERMLRGVVESSL